MTDEALAGQVVYYRFRAGECDMTAHTDIAAAHARIARLVAQMRPTGRVRLRLRARSHRAAA